MIGGNITAEIQTFSPEENEIGEAVKVWRSVQSLTGFLDLSGGDSKYGTYNAKIQESTHVFVCDYTELGGGITA